MKKLPKLPFARNRERGGVAMLVAVMWTTLFGMAVVAIDFGYLYTKRRNLQAIADSSVRAAMPVYVPNQTTAATGRARAIANANQISTVDTSEPSANHFRVTVGATYPTFFGSLFGFGSKTMSAKATGMLNVSGNAPAIYAGGPGCTPQYQTPNSGAIQINGAGSLVVQGDIATANDRVQVASWDPNCTLSPGSCRVTGNLKSPCAVYQDTSAPGLTVSGTQAVATADPLNPAILAGPTAGGACTYGNLTSALVLPAWQFNAGGNCWQFPTSEVYCSNAAIQLTQGGNICTTGTFISTVGVTVQTQGTVVMNPHATAPMAPNAANRLLLATTAGGDCGAAAMWLTSGAGASTFTMNGSLYAPNGCIHIGSDSLEFNENGLIDARMVFIEMGTSKTWTFAGPSGGVVSTAWSMAD